MRKKLSRILVTFVMVLCLCFGLTACKKNNDDNTDGNTPAVSAKVASISVGLAQGSAYTLTDNTITLEWGGKVNLTSSDFVVTATMSDSTTKTLSLKSDSNPSGYTFASTIPSDNVTGLGEYKLTFGHDDLEQTAYKEIKVKVVKRTIDVTSLNFIWTDSSSYRYDGQEKTVEITNMANFDFFGEVTYQGNSATNPNGCTTSDGSQISDQYDAVAIIKLKEGMDAYINLVANSDKFANNDELISLAYQSEANTIAINHKWSIGKKIIEVPNVEMVSYVYDGNPHSVAIKNLSDFTSKKIKTEIKEYVDNNLSSVPQDPTEKTNAGSYNIRINISIDDTYEDKNFCELSSENNYINAIWIISPKEINTNVTLKVIGESLVNKAYENPFTYDGNERGVYFDLSSIDTSYITGDNPILTTNTPADTDTLKLKAINAGTYTAKIIFTVNNSNYSVTNETVEKEWKINPFTIVTSDLSLILSGGTSTAYTDTSLVYNGTEQKVFFNLSGLSVYTSGTDPILTLSPEGVSAAGYGATNAGDYTATISFTVNNSNYAVSDASVSRNWKINKANLAVIAKSGQSFVYGTTKETIATTAELAPIGGSSIEFADNESEENKTAIYNILKQKITFEIRLDDGLNTTAYTGKLDVCEYRLYAVIPNDLTLQNYNVVPGGTVKFNITKKPLTGSVSAKTIAYGGTFEYGLSDLTLDGFAYDDTKDNSGITATFKYRDSDSNDENAWSTTKPTAVKEYRVKVEASASNYTFTINNGVLKIKQARLVVNAPAGKSFVYGTQAETIESDICSGITITGFVNNEDKNGDAKSDLYNTVYDAASVKIRDNLSAESEHSGEFDVGTYYIFIMLDETKVPNYYIDADDPVSMTITQKKSTFQA